MPTPVSISPGVYGSSATTTVADTTTSTVAAGGKVLALVAWAGSGTLSSIAGGGLTWTIHRQRVTAGSALRIAFCSADAPAGLASSTTVTATFSGSQDARSIRLASCAGLATNASGAEDGTSFEDAASTSTWTGSITTTNASDVLIGGAWFDFTTAGLAPAGGSTEVYDWTTSDGSELHLVFKEVSSAGANSVGGSGASNGRTSVAVAFKTTPAAYPFELLTPTPRTY